MAAMGLCHAGTMRNEAELSLSSPLPASPGHTEVALLPPRTRTGRWGLSKADSDTVLMGCRTAPHAQDVPLWHVHYFELRAMKTLWAHKKLFPLPGRI